MKTVKQLGFEILERNNIKLFGGAHLGKGNPKQKRPISVKKSMHLVMRALIAKGELSLLKKERKIQDIIIRQGRKFGVKIYRQANAGNHLHLTILPRSRQAFNGFIRSISGLIAREILGAERGSAKGIQFWDKRPFTRVIEWGRDFKTLNQYLLQNTLEAVGFIPYQPRKIKLKDSTA